jgi:hypothetical protein
MKKLIFSLALAVSVHATQLETINKYLKYLPTDKVTLEKLNKFRTKAGNFEICL